MASWGSREDKLSSIARRLYLKGKRFNCVAALVSSNQKLKQNDQDRRLLLHLFLLTMFLFVLIVVSITFRRLFQFQPNLEASVFHT
jgi:hypothetical protein